jgi:hypothetical protein
MILIPILILAGQTGLPFASRSLQTLPVPKGHLKIVFRGTNGTIRIQPGYENQIILKQLTRADRLPKLTEVRLDQSWRKSELTLTTKEDFKTPGEPSKKYPGAINSHDPTRDRPRHRNN